MRNQESTKKEAIHRKKIQAKNRSTIFKSPIKNEQPYKKKKLSLQQQIKIHTIYHIFSHYRKKEKLQKL